MIKQLGLEALKNTSKSAYAKVDVKSFKEVLRVEYNGIVEIRSHKWRVLDLMQNLEKRFRFKNLEIWSSYW